MAISPYSPIIPQFLQDFYMRFARELNLKQPYQSKNLVPGDRYGLLDLGRSLDADPELPALQKVRRGSESCQMLFHALTTVAVGGRETEPALSKWQAETVAIQEALNLDHSIAKISTEMDHYHFIRKIELLAPIDPVFLKSSDDADLWVVHTTTDILVKFILTRDQNRLHLYPAGATQSL